MAAHQHKRRRRLPDAQRGRGRQGISLTLKRIYIALLPDMTVHCVIATLRWLGLKFSCSDSTEHHASAVVQSQCSVVLGFNSLSALYVTVRFASSPSSALCVIILAVA